MSYSWDFPNNNHTNINGLSTSDMETFAKDPLGSLAREICQNSIDAQEGEIKSRVEFKLFEINRNDIPGIDELTKEINKAYEFKKDDKKEGKSLLKIKKTIEQDVIKCLRISDFNTTGLNGVSTTDMDSKFYKLTRGSGTSDKDGTSGGSKGIGKFASFVASSTNTVFYSTKTNTNEKGYMGICKLRSVPIDEEDPSLMTLGTGYFSLNSKHYAINEDLHLDKDFNRLDDQFGTDVYLIGFEAFENWQGDVIAQILDSFMAAIILNGFEAVVENVKINKRNLRKIIYESKLLNDRRPKEVKGIRAQYELLSSEDIDKKTFMINGDSEITVYVKKYDRLNEAEASKQCVMIRYPYMKIRHNTGYSSLPYSAICIIGDNPLNERLREIENPQHTDWEMKRLDSFPDEKKITKKMKKEMEDAVKEYISTVLRAGEGDSTDIEGAGDYLPSIEENDAGISDNKSNKEDVIISQIKRNELNLPNTEKVSDEGEEYQFEKGNPDGDDVTGRAPGGDGGEPEPNPNPNPEPDDEDTVGTSGESPVLKKVALSGVKFKNIVVNPKESRYDIVFTSPSDDANCELILRQIGESGDRYKMDITEATINGEKCIVDKGIAKGFKLEKGKKYIIQYCVSEDDVFACEVELNAYR